MFDLKNPREKVRRSFLPGTEFYLPKWQAFILDWVLLAFIVSLIGSFILIGDYFYAILISMTFILGYALGKLK